MPILHYQSRPKRPDHQCYVSPRRLYRAKQSEETAVVKNNGQTRVKHESNTCSFDQCKMQSMNPIQWWVCIRYSCLSGTLCSRYWSFADPYADVAVLLCISRVKRREEEICSVHQEEKRKKMIIYKRWPDATTCKTRWNNLLYKMKRFLIDVW